MPEITLQFVQKLFFDYFPDVSIQGFKYEPGANPGDSFTCGIYRIGLTGIRRPKGSDSDEPWETSIICKVLGTEPTRREVFETAFRNEAVFYGHIWPALQDFQKQSMKEEAIPIPKFYLCVDDYIMMVDLKMDGFQMIDRTKGLDLEQCYLILKHVSLFHALSLAMKSENPEVFGALVNGENGLREVMFSDDNPVVLDYYGQALQIAISMLKEEFSGPEYKLYLDKFLDFCSEDGLQRTLKSVVMPKEPLAVVCHGDLWTNNFLFKHVDGKLKEVYVIDFQQSRYASLALDLVQMLYICTERDFRAQHLTELLKYYTYEMHRHVTQMTAPDSLYNTSLDRDTLFKQVQDEVKRCLPFALCLSVCVFPIATVPNEIAFDPYNQKASSLAPTKTCDNEFRRKMTQLVMELVDNGIFNNLFKQVHDGKNLKGRANDAIASACLYIACRQEGVPRTFKEICAVSKISKKEIGRCFKLILKALETSVELITTADFMSRFCSNLGLPNSVQRAATHIARKAGELDIVSGRSPISVAAAAIYMASQASDDKRSQKEIGDIAGVADVTIRQSYKLMYPFAAKLFPEDFKFSTPIECLPQM